MITKWPMKHRAWRRLHLIVNRIAWRVAPIEHYKDPKKSQLIWRLNDWVAKHYTIWFATKGRKLK